MVTYRGINVSMVSQHGIRKLPEYEPLMSADPFRIDGPTRRSEQASIASCYVPLCPGSQIWFDYSIDNPHPPNAQYFFKLLRNGKVFTSWDCTAKDKYKGTTTYGLKYLGMHPQTGQPVIERQAFRFSTELPSLAGPFDDCVEVRVYRIEHRARLPLDAPDVRTDEVFAGESVRYDGFQLTNAGALGLNDPKRRYKYQLLDPVERPYVSIKFYYRTVEFLTVNGIIPLPSNHSRQTSTDSDLSHSSSTSFDSVVSCSASNTSPTRSPTQPRSVARIGSSRPGNAPTHSIAAWLRHHRVQKYTDVLAPLGLGTLVTLSDDDLAHLGIEAEGTRTKLLCELAAHKQQYIDHVEDAHDEKPKEHETSAIHPLPQAAISSPTTSTHISTSPKAKYAASNTLSTPPQKTIFTIKNAPLSPLSETASSAPAQKTTFTSEEIKPVSPAAPVSTTKSPRKPRKSLKVEILGAEFELEKESRRPLSPFTSGGMLRRHLCRTPPSAPARITAFGPTVDDEVNGMLAEMEAGGKPKVTLVRTTRAERGGGLLKKILGRRIERG